MGSGPFRDNWSAAVPIRDAKEAPIVVGGFCVIALVVGFNIHSRKYGRIASNSTKRRAEQVLSAAAVLTCLIIELELMNWARRTG